MASSSLAAVYARAMALQPVLKALTARGLRVNDALRRERIELLSTEADQLQEQAQAVLTPVVWDRLERPDLFYEERRCGCCGGGSTQSAHCVRCAQLFTCGVPDPITPMHARTFGFKTLKAFKASWPPCEVCSGTGKRYSIALNMGSDAQLRDLLYNGLGLPERTQHGKVTTDEEALQSLVALDGSGLVKLALRYGKLDTQRSIYERIIPAPDGHVRTVFNAAGTYTGRLAAAGAFYVSHSTNLHNLSASEAARDPLFAVRDVIVPDEGEVFIYADLSAAEARVTACLSEDHELLERWKTPGWDSHRWTASHVFSKPEIDVTPEERYLGKRCAHALNYGMGPNKFWRVINADADVTGIALTLTEAKRIHAAYHALHPNLDNVWWNRVERQLIEHGFLETVFGRRCNFYPRLDPETGALDADTLRAAIAFEPQSTVADLKTVALLDAFAKEGQSFRVLHEAHDALLVGAKRHAAQSTALILKRCLERPITVNGITLTIPAEVFTAEENWSHLRRVM